MPIYEYACPDCGHHGEHMQKLADAPIAECPRCHSTAYVKKISAAGFALKGTGWYVTDFRGSNGAANKGSGEKEQSSNVSTTDSKIEAAAAAPACGAGACPACAD